MKYLRTAAFGLLLIVCTQAVPQRIIGMTTWNGRGLNYNFIQTKNAEIQLFDASNNSEMGKLKVEQVANKEGACHENNLVIRGNVNAPGGEIEYSRYTFMIHENADCGNPGQPMFAMAKECRSCSDSVAIMTLASDTILQLADLETPENCNGRVMNINNRALVIYDTVKDKKKACGVIKCIDCP